MRAARGAVKEAGVTVTVEAITDGYRVGVGGPNRRGSAERADQHQQCGARQVEVGEQDIDGAKGMAGRYEYRRLALESADVAASVGGALEQPKRGGPDRDDAAAPCARRIQGLRRRRIEAAPFRVHHVIPGVLDLDGQKGARADVQRDPMQARAGRLDAREQGRREVKPRRRRRDGAGFVGEDRLVGLAILGRGGPARRDIRGQRRQADPLDRLVERRAGKCEVQDDFARLALGLDLGVERGEQAGMALGGFAEANALADFQLLRGTNERAPAAFVDALDQHRLDLGDRVPARAHPVETRGDDARVVDDNRVARPQEVRKIPDAPIQQRAVGADDEHARRLTRAVGSSAMRSGGR